MAYLHYFSDVRIELQQEVKRHPDLMEILSSADRVDFETQFAQVAAHCGVILDGDYLQEELDAVCRLLLKKLRNKRSIIITPNG